jgi:hypothetical protein
MASRQLFALFAVTICLSCCITSAYADVQAALLSLASQKLSNGLSAAVKEQDDACPYDATALDSAEQARIRKACGEPNPLRR